MPLISHDIIWTTVSCGYISLHSLIRKLLGSISLSNLVTVSSHAGLQWLLLIILLLFSAGMNVRHGHCGWTVFHCSLIYSHTAEIHLSIV